MTNTDTNTLTTQHNYELVAAISAGIESSLWNPMGDRRRPLRECYEYLHGSGNLAESLPTLANLINEALIAEAVVEHAGCDNLMRLAYAETRRLIAGYVLYLSNRQSTDAAQA